MFKMPKKHFSIGYKLPDERDSTCEIVSDYSDCLSEVYFALPGAASGRATLPADAETRALFREEIREIRKKGVGLVLLLNAACYGTDAVSVQLGREVVKDVESFGGGLKAVTTTSPFIAGVLKRAFPELGIRASVNMSIGTVKAMEYLSDSFDGFYIRRDIQRNIGRVREIRGYCDENGKTLHMLANSGCLYDCPFQTFHDNAVAHGSGIEKKENVPARYPAACWRFFSERPNRHKVLQNTWIRPEDIHRYFPFFDTVKLATRMHCNPRMVLEAYSSGRHYGNLLDLMEPSYSPLFAPGIIDNRSFPGDWFDKTSSCTRECGRCGYCAETFDKVLKLARII